MRVFSAAILATTMLVSSAFAADNAPLAPGKPAGVKAAQGAAPLIGTLLFGAAIIGVVGVPEGIARRLVDRCGTSPGGRIRGATGVDLASFEPACVVGHGYSLCAGTIILPPTARNAGADNGIHSMAGV